MGGRRREGGRECGVLHISETRCIWKLRKLGVVLSGSCEGPVPRPTTGLNPLTLAPLVRQYIG